MKLSKAGVVWATPRVCRALDRVEVDFQWDGLAGQPVYLEVADADHQPYHTATFTAGTGQARTSIPVGGKPGVHHIQIWTHRPDGTEYRRHGGFRVETRTAIRSDSDTINRLFELAEEGLRQTVDITTIGGKRITQIKVGDNTRQNLAYPIYPVAALRYFISDVKTMFEVLFDWQYPNGSLPDHIYGDNYPCPLTGRRLRSCMADMETGAASTLCQGWQAHGDNAWLAGMMERVELAMEFATNDPNMFDTTHGVIKRPHTTDEWDIHFTPDGAQGNFINENTRFVIMQGDTSGLYDASAHLAMAYESLGNPLRAAHWRLMRDHTRMLGNKLFWDGVKYLHHIHLDPFDHGDFDESKQLAMSNSWAITRGFADHDQAVSILNEYLRRQRETGDRFPWWSLQPGYPDHLNYFADQDTWRMTQGNYCNGGLFPWVGGELCRAAFSHGMEAVGYSLLNDFHYVLDRDNGAMFTWYDLQGNAAMNAPHNQTNHDAWGLFPWTVALIEEVAGIKSQGKCLENVLCTPRWPATPCRSVSATAHFPASDTYFAYRYEQHADQLTIDFTGTGNNVTFRVLLPDGCRPASVTLDGKPIAFTTETIEQSHYVACETAGIRGVRSLVCRF